MTVEQLLLALRTLVQEGTVTGDTLVCVGIDTNQHEEPVSPVTGIGITESPRLGGRGLVFTAPAEGLSESLKRSSAPLN